MPAQAGIHDFLREPVRTEVVDARLRGHDDRGVGEVSDKGRWWNFQAWLADLFVRRHVAHCAAMALRRDILAAASALAARIAVRAPGAGAVPAAGAGPVPATPLPLGDISVVGTRYHAASRIAPLLHPGDLVDLRREPQNKYDPWAVAVHAPSGERLGFLPKFGNRQVAELLDAGGQVAAEIMEGHPFKVGQDDWRISLRLSLRGIAPPEAACAAEREGLEDLLRAPPLLAQRFTGPGTGIRAVMLTGPCAGWQRTKTAEWVPPGSLPWPAVDVIARGYQLVGGVEARRETADALRQAGKLGIPLPGVPPRTSRPKVAQDRPPERAALLLRGWLDASRLGEAPPSAMFDPLQYMTLRRGPAGWRGALCVEVLDRDGGYVGCLPREAGSIVARLMDEGFTLDIVAAAACARCRICCS